MAHPAQNKSSGCAFFCFKNPFSQDFGQEITENSLMKLVPDRNLLCVDVEMDPATFWNQEQDIEAKNATRYSERS